MTYITGNTTARAMYASPIIIEEITDNWDMILTNANNRYTENYTGNGSQTKFTLQFTPTEIMSVKVANI